MRVCGLDPLPSFSLAWEGRLDFIIKNEELKMKNFGILAFLDKSIYNSVIFTDWRP